ncbi:hypothetical protein INH39_29680 [Massilia violaceinigra]|uniref:Uncharacterized protein n=1 Tax=Massilia violaceinigra TaxID=2045208 RepID=A0ABY4A418_9BURK|nr:hypothetical protein [Massilia violaceinigra]UOD29515.1 hypothetical protein INH39_29680 [Massilia violaceinigra]
MKSTLALVAAGVLSLMACDSKAQVNKKEISTAVANYLDQKGELCLDLTTWPILISPINMERKDEFPDSIVTQMEVLTALGLTAEAPGGDDPNDTNPYKPDVVVKRYVLTDAGKKLYREKEVTVKDYSSKTTKQVMEGDLCYAQKKLDKVISWTKPVQADFFQWIHVTYVYKVGPVAAWARNPKLSKAFPDIAENLRLAGKQQKVYLKLSDEGWDEYDLGFD